MSKTMLNSPVNMGFSASAISSVTEAGSGKSYPSLSNYKLCCAGSIFCAILLASGCTTLGPDFETPESTVTESWADSIDPAITTESEEHREWWKNFNDPVLDTLVQRAYEQNLTLQIAGLRVHEARAILGRASGRLYPQVQSAGGSISRVELSENAEPVSNLPPEVGSLVDTSFSNYRLNLDAAWELDFWGRFQRGVESADANLAATVATYDDFLVTLTGEVASSYVLLRTLEERLSFARKNVAIQERSLEIADVRFRNGLVSELDFQLARTLLGNTRSTIPILQTGI
ncbi:MAG: TolC family protein, partial [bacterium]